MKNVFVDLNTNTTDISEDELLQHIKDYVKNAKTKVSIVALEYILVDEEPIVDYRDEAFISKTIKSNFFINVPPIFI